MGRDGAEGTFDHMSVRILLAEDEPDIRLIARAALIRAGFLVTAVADGAEALRSVAEESPDLVVLDWMMPEVDGAEACARLKADPLTSHIPVIFLTARTDRAAEAQCLALGAVGCLTKPFNPLALGEDVKTLWHQSNAEPQA